MLIGSFRSPPACIALSLVMAACGRYAFDSLQGDAFQNDGLVDGTLPLDSSLSLWLRFGSARPLTDEVTGRSARCFDTECPTSVSDDRDGLSFNSNLSQCLRFTDAGHLKPMNFTLSIWVKHKAFRNMVYVAKRVGAAYANSFGLEYGPDSAPSSAAATASNTGGFANTFVIDPLKSVSLDRWNHVASTYDGSSLTLFVDGTAVAAGSLSAPVAYNEADITVGCDENLDPGVSGFYFDGVLSDLRLYSRVLKDEEIQRIGR